jgi:hypothetical protein
MPQIAFLAHCEEKKAAGEPCGCCTPQMMDGLRRKIAADATAVEPDNATASAEEAAAQVRVNVAGAAFGLGDAASAR